MNSQTNNSFNYNWNAFGTPYNSSSTYPPQIAASPLSPMTNSYSYSSHHYNSPSLSSGYGSENSFNNSPSMSHYLPQFHYSLPVYNQQYTNNQVQSFNLPTTKSTKRSRNELEGIENQEPKSTDLTQTKTKRSNTNKKRKLDEQIDELSNNQEIDDQFDDLDDENDLDNSDSVLSNDKKKRVLTKSQRLAANQRERKRMNIMNDSFNALRQALPISTGRKRRKMSRLDIVCGAMEYIAYLDQLLESEGPYEINFEAYQNSMYFYE